MFLLCNDLMEKIGNEVETIRYNKNLKEHKKKFIDVLNDFSDLIDDVEMELIEDYYYRHFHGTNHIYGNIKREFIHEVLFENSEIMDIIKENVPYCIKHIVLKKIDL